MTATRIIQGACVAIIALVITHIIWLATAPSVDVSIGPPGSTEVSQLFRGRARAQDNLVGALFGWSASLKFREPGDISRHSWTVTQRFFSRPAADIFMVRSAQATTLLVRSSPWPMATPTRAPSPMQLWLLVSCAMIIVGIPAVKSFVDSPSDYAAAMVLGAMAALLTMPFTTDIICDLTGLHDMHSGPWAWVLMVLIMAFGGLAAVTGLLARRAWHGIVNRMAI